MGELNIDKKTTALVVIDLQKGIASMPTQPYSAGDVIANAAKIIEAFRKNDMIVFLVHVNPTKETTLKVESDFQMGGRDIPSDWAQFVPQIGSNPKDIIITKHQWGAFYGTGLDMNLRRRGIRTIVLCGIATSIGVESTARFAYEYGYNQIFPEDAMASITAEEHNSTINHIFKKIGRIKKTSDVLEALK